MKLELAFLESTGSRIPLLRIGMDYEWTARLYRQFTGLTKPAQAADVIVHATILASGATLANTRILHNGPGVFCSRDFERSEHKLTPTMRTEASYSHPPEMSIFLRLEAS